MNIFQHVIVANVMSDPIDEHAHSHAIIIFPISIPLGKVFKGSFGTSTAYRNAQASFVLNSRLKTQTQNHTRICQTCNRQWSVKTNG